MPGKLSVMRRGSTSTTAPRAPRQMSSHMKPNRSWPGVPKRYITSVSSTVMRPKSMATVVVVFCPTWVVSSTFEDTEVMAASVRNGSISEMAPTKVVLPTPKPPATTNFTGTIRAVVRSWVACTMVLLVRDRSDGAHALDHLGEHVELDLDGIGVMDVEQAGGDQVAGDHRDDPGDELQVAGQLGHRLR